MFGFGGGADQSAASGTSQSQGSASINASGWSVGGGSASGGSLSSNSGAGGVPRAALISAAVVFLSWLYFKSKKGK